MKEENAIPIYKKSSKRSPSNYRPVSLTSVACKVVEKMIREKIMGHMKSNQMFTDSNTGSEIKDLPCYNCHK